LTLNVTVPTHGTAVFTNKVANGTYPTFTVVVD
jgi:hypothetical protein